MSTTLELPHRSESPSSEWCVCACARPEATTLVAVHLLTFCLVSTNFHSTNDRIDRSLPWQFCQWFLGLFLLFGLPFLLLSFELGDIRSAHVGRRFQSIRFAFRLFFLSLSVLPNRRSFNVALGCRPATASLWISMLALVGREPCDSTVFAIGCCGAYCRSHPLLRIARR